MKKNVNNLYIEECFMNIKKGDNIKENLNTIKRFLNRQYSMAECVDIHYSNNSSSKLFGMNVFPDDKTVNNFIQSNKKNAQDLLFKNKIGYIIDLDSKLFTDKTLNFNEGEITAILLHEIGHIAINTEFLRNLQLLFIETATKNEINIYSSEMDKYNDVISALFIYNFVDKTKINNRVKNYEVEIKADDFAIQQGYGEDLASALNKFAKYYNVTISKRKSPNSIKNEYEQEAEIFIEMVKNFKDRRQLIERSLKADMKNTPSELYDRLIGKVLKNIKKISDGIDNILLQRRKKDFEVQQRLTEGTVTRLLGITPKISQKDIDELKIEFQMIETNDDKLYLMRRIHNLMDDIVFAKSKTTDKVKLGNLNTFNKELNSLLNSVMKKEIEEKRYGVFVKCPKGYEG